MTKRVPLLKYLANLGYGSRREVTYLFTKRRVTDHEGFLLQPDVAAEHDTVRVDGEPLDPPPQSILAMNKPLGYVCSTTDPNNAVIYDLMPDRFRLRSPIMAPVGRLDLDTSGLLLITDDGQMNHRLTSPKSHVAKTYAVTVADALRGDEAALFAAGTLMLESETTPVMPAQFLPVSPTVGHLTLHEGRYHQVRRMFAAVGHHVTGLERISIGALPLGDLPPGTWRLLTLPERDLLVQTP